MKAENNMKGWRLKITCIVRWSVKLTWKDGGWIWHGRMKCKDKMEGWMLKITCPKINVEDNMSKDECWR